MIIPTRNCSHFISEAIESVFDQTYKNLEIVVIDDGSTDNTEEVVRNYPNVRYLYQEHRENSTTARVANAGLIASNGDYIICLCAVDKLAPTYVEKSLKAITQDPKVGIVFTGTKEFGASYNVRFPRSLPHKYSILRDPGGQMGPMMVKRALYFPCDASNAVSDDMVFPDSVNNNYPLSPNKLVGFYDERLHSLDDWDFGIRASLKGWKIVAIPEILHETRVHPGKISVHSDKSELYARYPYMILYTIISRGLDASKQFFVNPNMFLHKLYNKGAVRFLQANRHPYPPSNHQHSWVNEKSILQKMRQSKPSTILDCGCGEGRWGYLLKGISVIGIDRYKPYLRQAKRYEQVVCASVTCLPFQRKSFDACIAIELIEHLPKQDGFRFLYELKQTIRKKIVLTTPKVYVPINFGEDHPETHRSFWEKAEILACI